MALPADHWASAAKEIGRGPGVDRPREGERCKGYRLPITFGDAKPMTWIVMAPSAKKAKSYAKARWPHCNPVIEK